MSFSEPIKVLTQAVQNGAFPGAQLCVSLGGRMVMNEAVGNIAPNRGATTSETIYDLASLTKALITTTLFGRALEEGRLHFEERVDRHVPGASMRVRFKDLLDHSSGYPAHLRFDAKLKDTFPGTWQAWRFIVANVAQTPLQTKPGQQAVYSDLGFILIGAALERVYEQSLAKIWTQTGLPLFFRETRDGDTLDDLIDHKIAPTEHYLCGLVHDDNCRAMGGVAGHAGAWGTAEGVVNICQSLVRAYHGHRNEILRPETVRLLWTPSDVPRSYWAYGWDRPSPGGSTGGQWPTHCVGHLGFTGTSVWIEPQKELIVSLITNRVCPSSNNNLIKQIRPALYNAAWNTWAKA